MKSIVGFAALGLCWSVAALPWFDAGVGGYVTWPHSLPSWYLPGIGTWQGTADAELAQAQGTTSVQFYANAAGRSFVFDEPKLPVVQPKLSITAVLPPANVLPEVDSAAKGALIACRSVDGGATNYYALVADTGSNRWVRFDAPIPLVDAPVTLTIEYRGGNEIRYAIDGEALRIAERDWLPIVLPGETEAVCAVDFRGGGELRSFSGTTNETLGEPVSLTIPSLTGMRANFVMARGETVPHDSDGSYKVPGGARVTVGFVADDGYFLSSNTMSFWVGDEDLTLPEEGRPTALAATEWLRVNEILAASENGPDWIELANASDYAVDVTGWLLSDKPATKGKWTPIEGEAVIPARGFLVVRFDAASAVRCDLGLSADGETVAFATPGGRMVDEIGFGYQFKEVSYGRDATVTNWVHFTEPTPGAVNAAAGRSVPTPRVEFSVPHGYFTHSFTLSLSSPDKPGAAIYYTTDGTSPTKDSARYASPITISRTTVVRAAAVEANSILQRDASSTYLFVEDIVRQSGVPSGFPESGAVNGQEMHYGMRSSIFSADGTRLMRGFTNGVRTVSLVIDPANLFNASTGIYVNARQEGRAWERSALVEQIHPLDRQDEFACACGVRIRGAASRSSSAPKHSLRLFFRRDYGMPLLEHPIFGAEGATVCDKIDLRADQNQSYANGDSCETMVHEVFSRDSLRDMGQVSPNTRYFHLFLNGIYWGLYMYEERVSQCYAAAVNGGDEDDYDVIRTQQPGYVTDLVEGERTAMEQFLRIVNQEGFAVPYQNNYNRVRGLGADGIRDPALPVYLNVTNLVDLMLQVHFVADSDSPASATCFINQENNIMAFRNRRDGVGHEDGFIYLRHDSEWSMGFTEYLKSASEGARLDVTELGKNFITFCPSRFHWRLCDNAEYRMLVADRFYRHCLRSGGALTLERNEARFRARMAEIDEAIVGEVARWGAVPNAHANRETWLNSCETYCLAFLRERPRYHLEHYRSRGWYPAVDAPALKDANGETVIDGARFAAGTQLRLDSASSGTLYVTDDGSDPRREGGTVNPVANVVADGQWLLPVGTTTLKARVLSETGEWSALEEVRVVGADARTEALKASLRVCEVMSSTLDANGDGAEFIVFTNLETSAALNVTGVRVTCAKAGKDPSLDFTLEGQLDHLRTFGKLACWPAQKITNGKVEMVVYAPDGEVIQRLGFDADWWNGAADGTGAFFVAQDFGDVVTEASQWRASYPALTNGVGAAAVAAMASGEDERREWLVALGETEAGRNALADYARDEWQLEACFLLGIPPENADLELWIPSLDFSEEGDEVLLGGALRVNGTNVACRLNGRLKVRLSDTLSGASVGEIELQERVLPLPSPIRLPVQHRQFFRLLVD